MPCALVAIIDFPLLTLMVALVMVTPLALVSTNPVLAVILMLDKVIFCKILLVSPTKLPAFAAPVTVNWLIG